MVNHDFEYYGSLPDGTYRVYAAPIGDNGVQQKDEHARERIARALHYPACWDTAAYPTLDSAALEAIACAKLGCSECEKPSDASDGSVYRCNQCGSFDIERYPYAASQPAESKREDFEADAKRLALELECLLLSCKDQAAVSKWWDSAMEALEQHRALLARASAKGE
jgi:hypothetical protein